MRFRAGDKGNGAAGAARVGRRPPRVNSLLSAALLRANLSRRHWRVAVAALLVAVLAVSGPFDAGAQVDSESTTTTQPQTAQGTTSEASSTTGPSIVAEDEPATSTTSTTISPRKQEKLIPPPIDIASLDVLLEERRAAAVMEATVIADAANADANVVAEERRTELLDLLIRMPAADDLVASTAAAEAAAARHLDADKARLGEVAVESYQLAVTGNDAVLRGRAAAMSSEDNYQEFVRVTTFGEAAWASLHNQILAEEEALEAARDSGAEAVRERESLERVTRAAAADFDDAERHAETVKSSGDASIFEAGKTGEELALGEFGPTILGETLVSAEDMAAFVAQRGRHSPAIDPLELASYYVLEGTAEGVRGDIALVQAILETGNFGFAGSMVAVSDFNYAGIGACDSCSSGFNYETMQMGIRDQMQLLHTYAEDGLTAGGLAFPVVRKAPEKSSVRGCCATWMELSGVWATGPGYGVKILTIYNEMLSFAAQRQALRRQAPTSS